MPLEARPRRVEIYVDPDGKEPYTRWLNRLRDRRTKNRIIQRVRRIKLGNFGDHRALGEGVYELRLFFGPGYRVYFAEADNTLVILLCGGHKGSQQQDIERAKTYWKHYQEG